MMTCYPSSVVVLAHSYPKGHNSTIEQSQRVIEIDNSSLLWIINGTSKNSTNQERNKEFGQDSE